MIEIKAIRRLTPTVTVEYGRAELGNEVEAFAKFWGFETIKSKNDET